MCPFSPQGDALPRATPNQLPGRVGSGPQLQSAGHATHAGGLQRIEEPCGQATHAAVSGTINKRTNEEKIYLFIMKLELKCTTNEVRYSKLRMYLYQVH